MENNYDMSEYFKMVRSYVYREKLSLYSLRFLEGIGKAYNEVIAKDLKQEEITAKMVASDYREIVIADSYDLPYHGMKSKMAIAKLYLLNRPTSIYTQICILMLQGGLKDVNMNLKYVNAIKVLFEDTYKRINAGTYKEIKTRR